jgi:hypothetical protein
MRVGEKGGSGKVGVLLDHTVKNNFYDYAMLDYTARNVLSWAIDSALSVYKVRRARYSFLHKQTCNYVCDH